MVQAKERKVSMNQFYVEAIGVALGYERVPVTKTIVVGYEMRKSSEADRK